MIELICAARLLVVVGSAFPHPLFHSVSQLSLPLFGLSAMSLSLDYYALLDIQRDASDLQIKQAYRRLALQWHPLKNKTDSAEHVTAQFSRISEAYDVLTDRQTETHSRQQQQQWGRRKVGEQS